MKEWSIQQGSVSLEAEVDHAPAVDRMVDADTGLGARENIMLDRIIPIGIIMR